MLRCAPDGGYKYMLVLVDDQLLRTARDRPGVLALRCLQRMLE